MSRLDDYLALAEEICQAVDALAAAGPAALRAAGNRTEDEQLRDRVLVALALKIDGALRSVIDDARLKRSETMHHLKTMAEAFIYFRVVLADDSRKMARLVLADACERRATYLRVHRQLASEAPLWEKMAKEERGSLTEKLPSLEQLAEQYGGAALKTWYSEVYRLACEPAHLGDLFEYMPDPETGELPERPDSLSTYRAQSALFFASGIVIDTLRAIIEYSAQPLTAPVDHLAERLVIVSGIRRNRPSWNCGECGAKLEAETIGQLNPSIAEHITAHAPLRGLDGAESR